MLAEKSLRRIKTGENAPRSRVVIGGMSFGEGLLKSAQATYAVSEGTSEATVSTSLPLDDFINAPVRISFGYGFALAPYFDGNVAFVEDDDFAATFTATAYGPYRNMAEQELGEQVDYRGFTLLDVFIDLQKRAGQSVSRLDIQGGRNFILQGEDAIFPFETKLSDVATMVAEAGGYIVCDMPDLRRVVKPRPRPGATTKAVARYDESNIPLGGFRAPSSVRRVYGRVALFRRGEGGGYDFPPVIVPVAQRGKFKALPGKTYTVSDYMGDQRDALADAERLARLLEGGMHECELSGVAVNPEVMPHDTLSVAVREWRWRGGRKKEAVVCTYLMGADGTITASIDTSGNRMSISGGGILVKEQSLPSVNYVSSGRRSEYAMKMPTLPMLTPSETLTPSARLTPGRKRQHA